ncbi:MAG: hypothetical protein J6O61_08010 [Butyrivibrio sp.]|uniref:hypothetical protein n=1 Tax=Butyrivibrio sp. TaxID=28121 RepID=UPI001B223E31|nr:hypothetical protein [Butyrivibrio sp.]MBO6240759.1 hypothetical protein [Butyrivibrio sp.]
MERWIGISGANVPRGECSFEILLLLITVIDYMIVDYLRTEEAIDKDIYNNIL